MRNPADFQHNLAGPEFAQARRRRVLLWLGVFLACGAAALSMLSVTAKQKLHTKGQLHSLLHLALFSVLGALAILSTLRRRTRFLLILASIALGVTIEYTEAWRFQSALEVKDIFTDVVGTVLGALAAWFLSLTEY